MYYSIVTKLYIVRKIILLASIAQVWSWNERKQASCCLLQILILPDISSKLRSLPKRGQCTIVSRPSSFGGFPSVQHADAEDSKTMLRPSADAETLMCGIWTHERSDHGDFKKNINNQMRFHPTQLAPRFTFHKFFSLNDCHDEVLIRISTILN